MKDRASSVLRYIIFAYTVIAFLGLYSEKNNLTRGMWNLINDLSLNTVDYSFGTFVDTYYYQFIVLLGLIIIRYIVSGKTLEK